VAAAAVVVIVLVVVYFWKWFFFNLYLLNNMHRYIVTLHAPVFLIYRLDKVYELPLWISLHNWGFWKCVLVSYFVIDGIFHSMAIRHTSAPYNHNKYA
jgi:hypothetical protein